MYKTLTRVSAHWRLHMSVSKADLFASSLVVKRRIAFSMRFMQAHTDYQSSWHIFTYTRRHFNERLPSILSR